MGINKGAENKNRTAKSQDFNMFYTCQGHFDRFMPFIVKNKISTFSKTFPKSRGEMLPCPSTRPWLQGTNYFLTRVLYGFVTTVTVLE